MGWKNWKPKRLVCPLCGYDGTTHPDGAGHTYDCDPFYWVEDQPMLWPILGVYGKAPEGGQIIMSMNSELGDESKSHTARIACASCGEEFPVPKGVSHTDWTDQRGFDDAGGFDRPACNDNPRPANLAPDIPCCCIGDLTSPHECCPGWAHFDDPVEIQRCDSCFHIGARSGLASDLEAILAHRRQHRSCDHPEQACRKCGGPMHQCETGDPGCYHCDDAHCGGTRLL